MNLSKIKGLAARRSQGGFTLIELTVVFLILVVLAVIAVPRIQSLIIENKTPTVARELQAAVTRMRGSRAQSGATPYAGITAAQGVAELGAMLRNTSFTVTGAPATAVVHPLGTGTATAAVTVAEGTITTAGDSFTVTLAAVDRAGCGPLSATLANASEVVVVGASTAKAAGGQFNAGTAQTACDDDDGVDMVFTFK